MKNKGNRMR